MSLTPDEIAMCRDALLEAGVPQRIVAELIDFGGFMGRVRVVRATQALTYQQAISRYQSQEEARVSLWRQLAHELNNNGLVTKTTREEPGLMVVELGLEVSVLTPRGCHPPAKVQR
jgi:hypothetical protein